jgi:hypothetical protein
METDTKTLKPHPPGLVQALRAGLDTVANNLYLLVLPILLDLILWLGPRLSLKTLLTPMVEDAIQQLMTAGGTTTNDMMQVIAQLRQVWEQFLESFNLLSLASTFPVGIPSLLSTWAPATNPLGNPMVSDITTASSAWSIWFVIILVGFLAGSYYMGAIARRTLNLQAPYSLGTLGGQTLQSLVLTIVLIGILLGVGIPILVMTGILAAISPVLLSPAIFVLGLVCVWIFMPIIFAPHGIFTFRQNALGSIRTSMQVVNGNRAGVGMFVLSLMVLEQGLRMLWQTPTADSWLLLVGIIGHAFISTSLLSASFYYYRDGFRWWQEQTHQSSADKTPAQS